MARMLIAPSLPRICIVIEAALGLLVLPTAGIGQEPSAQESQAPGSDVLEEIFVYGEAPLTALRVEVYRTEDNYFAMFNELNSADEFDIRCRWTAPTGTRIKQRVCRAKFVDEVEARAFREGVPFAAYGTLVEEKAELLQDEMRTLVFKHPELLNALNEFGAAKDRFESERQRRCAPRMFFCRR